MASARYIYYSSCWKEWVEEVERDPGTNAFVKTPKRLFRWRPSGLDSDEVSSDKVTIVYVAQGHHLEAREPGVRGIWNEGGDEDQFREHMNT